MSGELKQAFLKFRDDAIYLQHYHNIHHNLFEASEETRQLLLRTAHVFFLDLSWVLVEYQIVMIGRITDRASTNGKFNLSISYITSELKKKGLATPNIEELSTKLNEYGAGLRDARNKLVAHADKETIMSGTVLGEHKRKDMLKFFSNLQRYCDAVGETLGAGPLDFSMQAGDGDVLSLIQVLEEWRDLKANSE